MGKFCCIPRRTACIMLGTVGLFFAVCHLATIFTDLHPSRNHMEATLNSMDRTFRQWREEEAITEDQLLGLERRLHDVRALYPYLVVLGLGSCVVGVIKHSCLLTGALHESSAFLLAFLVLEYINIFVSSLIGGGIVFLTFYYIGVQAGLVALPVVMLLMALAMSLWYMVVLYRRDVKDKSEDKLPIVFAEVPPPYENILNKK